MTLHCHTKLFEGAPRTALAIHCTLGHAGAWRGMAAALQEDLSLLAFDLPSHGKSGVWDRTGNLHDVATDMARSLLPEEPMDLIGHSFGGTVALRIAIETPERVRSLTMIEPVFLAAAFADDPALLGPYKRDHKPLDDAFARGDEREAARVFNRDWGDGTPWDSLPERMKQQMTKLVHYVPASAPMIKEDSAGLLAPGMFDRAVMPSLLIEGGKAPPISGKIAAALERRLPDVERVVLEEAGHMAPITHPEICAAPVRRLLARS